MEDLILSVRFGFGPRPASDPPREAEGTTAVDSPTKPAQAETLDKTADATASNYNGATTGVPAPVVSPNNGPGTSTSDPSSTAYRTDAPIPTHSFALNTHTNTTMATDPADKMVPTYPDLDPTAERALRPVHSQLLRLKATTRDRMPPPNDRLRVTHHMTLVRNRLLPIGDYIVGLTRGMVANQGAQLEMRLCRYIAKHYWPLPPKEHGYPHLDVHTMYRNAMYKRAVSKKPPPTVEPSRISDTQDLKRENVASRDARGFQETEKQGQQGGEAQNGEQAEERPNNKFERERTMGSPLAEAPSTVSNSASSFHLHHNLLPGSNLRGPSADYATPNHGFVSGGNFPEVPLASHTNSLPKSPPRCADRAAFSEHMLSRLDMSSGSIGSRVPLGTLWFDRGSAPDGFDSGTSTDHASSNPTSSPGHGDPAWATPDKGEMADAAMDGGDLEIVDGHRDTEAHVD